MHVQGSADNVMEEFALTVFKHGSGDGQDVVMCAKQQRDGGFFVGNVFLWGSKIEKTRKEVT
jgi:hypothetical protein